MEFGFPKNFFWGTATSAHQIEGNNINNWTKWEQSRERLNYLAQNNLNPADYISSQAADSYNRIDEDIKCIKQLNNNAYRFSLEWSRIEPEEGKFSEIALSHYQSLIQKLLDNKIEPFVTLWHWTIPQWLDNKQGWLCKKSVDYFSNYVSKVIDALGNDVKYWIKNNTFLEDEIAARFHHRLVSIHLFPNGNGRHARLVADILLENILNKPSFTWGNANLVKSSDDRKRYIESLIAADRGEYKQLLEFVRS